MTIEGVGETRSLADALSLLCFHVRSSALINCRCYLEADLRRLLQSLQNFGQVAPLSTLLAAFASFHSAAHFFCRSRAATCPALGSFCVLAFLSDAVAFCCAAADEMICGIGVMTSPTVSAAANTALSMISLPFISKGAGRCRSAGRSPQPAPHDNPHRLYRSILRSHETFAGCLVAEFRRGA